MSRDLDQFSAGIPGMLYKPLIACALACSLDPLAAQSFERVWIDELLDGDHRRAEESFLRIGNDPEQPIETRALALGRAAEIARVRGREEDQQARIRDVCGLLDHPRIRSLAVAADSLPSSALLDALAESDPGRAARARAASRERLLEAVDATTRIRVYVEPIRRLTMTARDLEFARLRNAIETAESSGDTEGATRARRDLQRRMVGESIRLRVQNAMTRIVQSLAAKRIEDADEFRERIRGFARGTLGARRTPRTEVDPRELVQEIRTFAARLEAHDPQSDDSELTEALGHLLTTLRSAAREERWGDVEALLARLPRGL